ncbi:MAG: FAD-binding oxidoreductase [Gammaproteobacteria bacterium]|nr:FAD-binding oxidoreductase [Gammaproteobacteria bacterium]
MPDNFSAHTPGAQFFHELRNAVRSENVRTDPAYCWAYSYDNSRRQNVPAVVVLPATHAQVAAVVTICNAHSVPVTARGLGTGTAGAAVPETGGLVLSTENMRNCKIDADNRVAVVQPGCINGDLQRAAAQHGFFWPPDPTSAEYSTIGGNLACNAAGPRAVKYGTPRENTLGLRAVTGDGVEIRSGCYTTKGVVGYDLTRLIIGSEGTLAVITEATLRLTPVAEGRRALRILYTSAAAAARAVSRIMAQSTVPCALEFTDAECLQLIRNYSGADIPAAARAMLIVEVDGRLDQLDTAAAAIAAAAAGEALLECRAAKNADETKLLWQARKALSPALRNIAPKKINEDVVVPVSRLGDFVVALKQISDTHGILIVAFGHAGNGNLHVNLLVDPDDTRQTQQIAACLQKVFATVIDFGGTLSGEHGIGYEKKEFVGLEIEPATLALMKRIKKEFDPGNILNPGKLFPSN